MKFGIILITTLLMSGCGSSINKAITKVPGVGSLVAEGNRLAEVKQGNITKSKAAGIPIFINKHGLYGQRGQLIQIKGAHEFRVEIDNISNKRIKDITLLLNPYTRDGKKVTFKKSETKLIKSDNFLGKAPKGGTRTWRVILDDNADCAIIVGAIVNMSDGSVKTISKDQLKLAYPSQKNSRCGAKY